MEPWQFPLNGSMIERRAILTVGPNMVSVDNIFSKVFDLEQQGYNEDQIKLGLFDPLDEKPHPGGIRSEITDFTRASRTRLQKSCSLWVPVGQMVFITLTYGKTWPHSDDRRAHFKTFCDRLRVDQPDLAGCWKLEYQRRGAPHYHMVAQTGERHVNLSFMNREIHDLWCDVIGQKARTAVELPRNEARAKYYLAKEVGKMVQASTAEREKCNTVVDHTGRFWGWHNRRKLQFKGQFYTLPSDLALCVREAIQAHVIAGMKKDGVAFDTPDGQLRFKSGQIVEPDLLPGWRMYDDGAHAFALIRQHVLDSVGVDLFDHMSPVDMANVQPLPE